MADDDLPTGSPHVIRLPPDPEERRRGATRYLCAAAYLDEDFRRKVLQCVLQADRRAVAPSYSIDVVPVLRHAVAARRQALTRDAWMTVALVVALVIDFWPVLGLMGLLYAFAMAGRAMIRMTARQPAPALIGFVLAGGLGLVGLYALVRSFTAATFMDEPPIADRGRLLVAGLVLVVGTLAAGATYRLDRHRTLLASLTATTYRPDAAPSEPPEHHERLAYLDQAQQGNVTFYARAARSAPFVGCGRLQDSWSLAIPLRVEDESVASRTGPLTQETMYQQMRRALLVLADPSAPEADRIPGLTLQERLFVSGLLPVDHALIGPKHEPRTRISAEELRRFGERSDRNPAARYLSVRVGGWEGELDVTALLYFSVRGNTLYFEFLGAGMPAIRDAYRAADSAEPISGRIVTRHVLQALRSLFGELMAAPLNLVEPVFEAVQRGLDDRSEVRAVTGPTAFDYGAVTGVRELGADWGSAEFFHQLDTKRHLDVIARRCVDAIADILERHGYDVEEFRTRATVNIDNSMTIGSVNATNSAVAIGPAQASVGTPQPAGARGRSRGRGITTSRTH